MDFINRVNSINVELQKKAREYIKHLDWSSDQIVNFQQENLRKILAHAKLHSNWHRKRLKDINPETATLDDLKSIPVMTKKDVMENWDEIVCDRSITKKIAEKHQERIREGEIDNPFYDDKYLFLCTGGSSGFRGLFLHDFNFIINGWAIFYRCMINDPTWINLAQEEKKMASVFAPSWLHSSYCLKYFLPEQNITNCFFPVTLPVDVICEQLNLYQPTHILTYPSMLNMLLLTAKSGKLNIAPLYIQTAGEMLENELRFMTKEIWGIGINENYLSVDMGMLAYEEESGSSKMHIIEDCDIIEVANAQRSSGINKNVNFVITKLYDYTFPIIRYKADDLLTVENPGKTGSRYILSVDGRSDVSFLYGDLEIHSMLFRHVLGQYKSIGEYQVIQTKNGATVYLVSDKNIEVKSVANSICSLLQKAGLKDPLIEVNQCDSLQKHPESGKCRRFIPLNRKT